ncbi:MAG: methyltransferase domain-containing protein [bacterium]
MTDDGHTGHLAQVYDAKDAAEVAALYDAWAGSYDAEMAEAGYRHPSIGLALLARHLPRGASPVLDAGAGTGLLGDWLGIMGYPVVEGLDISQGMLAVARSKGSYAALHCLALGGALPFAQGYFAGIISTGVFTTGHVGAEALPELVRVCRRGGVIVLTVKDAIWTAGFGTSLAGMVAAGQVAIAEQTASYVSMPGVAGTSPSRAVVLRVTG